MSSLTTDLKTLILDLRKMDRITKKAEAKKKELRSELFDYATSENSEGVLARQVITIPLGFLNNIGMQENHFLASRYPGWRKVESRKVNDQGEEDREGTLIEFLLEKDPAYLPFSIEVEDNGLRITAGRTIQQNSPELDQRSLQKDMPEVFDKIMKPVVSYEVDTVKLEELLAKKPELLPRLELHFAYPTPITKLSPIREKKDE